MKYFTFIVLNPQVGLSGENPMESRSYMFYTLGAGTAICLGLLQEELASWPQQ